MLKLRGGFFLVGGMSKFPASGGVGGSPPFPSSRENPATQYFLPTSVDKHKYQVFELFCGI